MVQTLGGKRVAQGLHHMSLPHHFREIFRAVFAGQDKVGHARDSKGDALTKTRTLHRHTVGAICGVNA